MNRFTFSNTRLTKDPEMQTSTSGTKITTINIAVNRERKNEEGKYDADFFQLKAFNKLAETIGVYCHKGDSMLFEGHIRNNSYEDKNGQKRYTNEFIIDKLEFGSKARQVEHNAENDIETNTSVENDPYADMGAEVEVDESDLPFNFN